MRCTVRLLSPVLLVAGLLMAGCTGTGGNPLGLDLVGLGSTSSGGLSISATANPSSRTVAVGQQVTLSVSANNVTGPLAYDWRINGGSISSTSSNPVVWTAPESPGIVSIQVTVTSGTDSAQGAYRFNVQ